MGVYIRIKHRKNKGGNEHDYAYLVHWRWRKRSYAKQHHLRYLGKIYALPKKQSHPIAVNHALDQKTILKDLIRVELLNHGFSTYKKHLYTNATHYVDLDKGTIYNQKGKEIVLQLNAGFLCTYSLNKLLNYTLLKKDRSDMKAFAKTLALTGITLTPDEFVDLYRALTEHDLA